MRLIILASYAIYIRVRFVGLAPVLALAGACGPSVPAEGDSHAGTSSAGSSSAGPTSAHDGSDDARTSTSGHVDTTDAIDETTASDTTGEPEPPLPPGLDVWGFTLVWTGIIGDRFAIADIDDDGHLDVSAHLRSRRDTHTWSLTTHVGYGDTTFAAREPVQRLWDRDFVVGDFDGDGRIELLGYASTEGIRVLTHAGDGRFTMAWPAELLGGAGGWGAVLDVDGNGLDDLVMGAYSHSTPGSVMLNQGGYVFAGEPELPYPACFFAEMVPVDRDGDGDTELFATGTCNSGSPDYSWYAYYDNVGGTLAVVQAFPGDPTPYEGTRPRPVDFDDDGREDLAIAAGTWTDAEGITSTGLLVFTNQAAGDPYQLDYFVHEWAQWGPSVFGLRLPGDGRAAVVADQGDHDSQLLLRAADGRSLEAHPVWLDGSVLDVADFDEDGCTDVVVTRPARGLGGAELGIWRSGCG